MIKKYTSGYSHIKVEILHTSFVVEYNNQ